MFQTMGTSCAAQPLSWTRIAFLSEIPDMEAIKFTYRQGGIPREGFLYRLEGQVKAFENACRHIPIPLDYGDGHFFDSTRSQILCQNHGALFDTSTGLCVRGPCEGAFLKQLTVCLEDGGVYLRHSD